MSSYGAGFPAVVSRVEVLGDAGGIAEGRIVGELKVGTATGVSNPPSGLKAFQVDYLTTDTSQGVNGATSYLQSTPAAATAQSYAAGRFQSESTASNAQNYTSSGGGLVGAFIGTLHRGTGTVTLQRGVRVTSTLSAAGTATTLYGYDVQCGNTSTGTIGDLVLYRAQATANASGTITRQAIFLSQAQTTATNNSYIVLGQNSAPDGNWAIYSVTANDSQFAGKLDLSPIAAGSPVLKITATNDTPTVAFTDDGTAAKAPTTAPAGYLEILVGSDARYIPFWA